MKDTTEFKSLDQWLELPRDEKLRTLFYCQPSWRKDQVEHLWGPKASGYDNWAYIPSGVAWNDIANVVISGNCHCSVEMKMKPEYISQISLKEFRELMERVNIPGKICRINPVYANRGFYAFNSWRYSNLSGGKKYIFTVEKFDENTLLFQLCIEAGDYGDEDGFGIEPDIWTSALFDVNGNIVQPFRPGIISPDKE